MLNSTVLQTGNSSANLNSPHHCTNNNQRVSGQFTSNSKTPTQLLQNNIETNINISSSAQSHSKKNSSNNLLSNVTNNGDYESPSVFNSATANVNTRLSRNRNNMSNNNLSTSASLLDATTDDAMSSRSFMFFYLSNYRS